MSYLNWHVGMKVVCVAAQERINAIVASLPGSVYPTSGKIYTIREIRDDSPLTNGKTQIVVLLCEIDNSHLVGRVLKPGTKCFVEPGFNPNGFRPVQTRKTDISIFNRILLNPHIRISEDA